MSGNYETRLDKVFSRSSGLWKHRTLRTVLDEGSTEWADTTMQMKLEILSVINQKDSLDVILLEYKQRYKDDQYIIDSIDRSLLKILSFSLLN